MSRLGGADTASGEHRSFYGPLTARQYRGHNATAKRRKPIDMKLTALVVMLVVFISTGALATMLLSNAHWDTRKAVPLYNTINPIRIEGDAAFTSANGVVGGSGTFVDPFVIEGWDIDATTVTGIWVSNTTLNFTVRAVSVHSGGITSLDILLVNVANATVDSAIVAGGRIGVAVFNSSFATVTNCTVQGTGLGGIFVAGSSNVSIVNNALVLNQQNGIDVQSSAYMALKNNTFRLNTLNGLVLARCSNIDVAGNLFFQNPVGVILIETNLSAIQNNMMIQQSSTALFLSSDCHNNTVQGNTLMNSTGLGAVTSVRCADNLFAGNNFINNSFSPQAADFNGLNRWNDSYPTGGNHWSDYTGVDLMSGPNQDVLGPDGIGDTPYTISSIGIVVDQYPLMDAMVGATAPNGIIMSKQIGLPDSLTFEFNASASWDPNDNITLLQVRWDFEGDGIFDTSFSTAKVVQHTYASPGIFRVVMEVKDPAGHIATASMLVVPGSTVVPEFGAFVPLFAIASAFGIGTLHMRRRSV